MRTWSPKTVLSERDTPPASEGPSGLKPISDQLEEVVRMLTKPLNGQYPRPWMTSLTSPSAARVFTVGRNQHHKFAIDRVRSHKHYVDTLFNRGPETCRDLYDRITGQPSPTRLNTDRLVHILARNGIADVLETNVICYSTPMSAHLRKAVNAGGVKQGREIFAMLLHLIRPRVLIAHGSGTAKELGRVLKCTLPKPPDRPSKPVKAIAGETLVFIIPTLAPPAYRKWASWSDEHLEMVCSEVAAVLPRGET